MAASSTRSGWTFDRTPATDGRTAARRDRTTVKGVRSAASRTHGRAKFEARATTNARSLGKTDRAPTTPVRTSVTRARTAANDARTNCGNTQRGRREGRAHRPCHPIASITFLHRRLYAVDPLQYPRRVAARSGVPRLPGRRTRHPRLRDASGAVGRRGHPAHRVHGRAERGRRGSEGRDRKSGRVSERHSSAIPDTDGRDRAPGVAAGARVLNDGRGVQHSAERRLSEHRANARSEEHTSELQSPDHLVCRLLLEKKKIYTLR